MWIVCRARASGKLMWHMEWKLGTYLEHLNKPLKGTRVPTHSGLVKSVGWNEQSRQICQVQILWYWQLPTTPALQSRQWLSGNCNGWNNHRSLHLSPTSTQLQPSKPKTAFFLSIYPRSMSRPGHMLLPKPVHHESSHKTFAYFLTYLVAASEVSSILKSCISGSSLGGNIEEMEHILSWFGVLRMCKVGSIVTHPNVTLPTDTLLQLIRW